MTKKINIDELKHIVSESVKQTLKEFIYPNEPSTDYQGNDLDFYRIVEQAVSTIYDMEQKGEDIRWVDVAKNMGFHLDTLNEDDMVLLHDAIEYAMGLPVLDDDSSVNEEHGNKKHKSPKNALNAVRKGNRDAEREIYGDGFRPGKKVHKAKNDYSRKSNKVDINNLEKYNESTIKLSENDLKQIVLESYKRLMGKFINEDTIGVDYSDKDDFGKYAPGLSVNWGNNIESLISKLEEKFSEVIAPEEDEYGISLTPLENLINHLKYYYEHETFDSACFNSIYKMLDNYDFTSDEEVLNILKQLKKYC